jgi:type IV pilus assembly protein PilM
VLDIKKNINSIVQNVNKLLSPSKKLVGLDIGSSSLKLVALHETSKGYILKSFHQVPVPRGVIVDGILVGHEELTARIKELFKISGCSIKNVVISLSGHAVIVKKVSFTSMDEGELRDLINDEASKYLPFDNTTAVYFDFQNLGANDFNPSLMDVLLVAAKKDIIDGYVEAITGAGLTSVIVDVDSFALETMYEENYDYEQTDVVVIINIGASITNINVVKNGMSIFTRDFTLGGNTVTEAIQAKLGVTFDEAEKMKIAGPEGAQQLQETGALGLLSLADPICLEIERSVDYFRSTFGNEEIKLVLLSGGGAMIPRIAAEIAQRLGIDTELINPFRKIGYDKEVLDVTTIESIGPIAAVGVGLALRKIGDK